MNWLYVALPLLAFYVFWFGRLLFKKRYDRTSLLFALAHIPYLLVNLAAPFRGAFDPGYAGYSIGWLSIPKGFGVTLVTGFIVLSCLLLATRALQNRMRGLWTFAFLFDLFLAIAIALPLLLDIFSDPAGNTIELGEYLTINGIVVGVILFGLFSGPTFYACFVAGRHAAKSLFGKGSLGLKAES